MESNTRTCITLHPSGTAWKLYQDLTLQLPIVRKDQLASYARFIDATFTNPSCPRPTTFADGRHTLYVKCKYCLFGVKKYIFLFSFYYALFGMLLKGMGERFLLSKDEPLTPDIDGVMALYSCPASLEEIRPNLLIPELRNCPRWDNKFWYKMDHHNMMKIFPPICYWPFPSQIWPNALWVRSMIMFWGLRD